MARGLSNKDIARELFYSVATVNRVVSELMRGAGCSTRTELVALAYAQRILPVGTWPPTVVT